MWHLVGLYLREQREKRHELFATLGFFLLALTLFRQTFGYRLEAFSFFAPYLIWLLVALSLVLAVERAFDEDRRDGTLEALFAYGFPLYGVVWAKFISCSLTLGVPVLLAVPVAGMMLALPVPHILLLCFCLLFVVPILLITGLFAASLTLALTPSSPLAGLLGFPLLIPPLLFSLLIIETARQGGEMGPQLMLLAAFMLVLVGGGPFLIAQSLRFAVHFR